MAESRYYSSVINQVKTIRSFNRPVMLIDDLLHKGYRMRMLVPYLEECGIDIKAVLTGVMTGRAADMMSEWGIRAECAYFLPTLEVWLKGNIGPVAELFNEDLDEADNAEVIRKLLDTLKSALMEERQMELALRASEALLQFNPEDPYEIRDRGLIYAQLDCDHVALLDLSYFVEQCPEDPISEMIRAQINTISHKQITLH